MLGLGEPCHRSQDEKTGVAPMFQDAGTVLENSVSAAGGQ